MQFSRSAKVLILSSGHALTSLVGVVSAAVLARVFSQTDYASYRQTMLAYTFAVPFVMLGFDRALYFFLPGEKERTRGILIENISWLFCAGGVLSIFLLCGGSGFLATRFHNPDLESLLLLLVPYPLLMLPASSLSACLMAQERTEYVAGFNVVSRVLIFLAVTVPCLFWATPRVAIVGTLLGAGVTTAFALTLMFRACNTGDWRPTWLGIRKQVEFSLPLGLATLVGAVAQNIGQVIVSSQCAPDVFAVFVNGAMEIPLIGIITGSVTSVVMVDYVRFHRENRTDDIVKLIHSAMTKCGVLLLPVMMFFLCMAPETMRLIYGDRYEASATPFRLFLLMLPLRTVTFGAILQATGNSRHVLIYSVLFLVTNTVLTLLGVRYLGALLSPVGSVLADLLTLMYPIYIIRRTLNRGYYTLFPWYNLVKLTLASVAGIPALIAVKVVSGAWPCFFTLAATLLLYALITLGTLCYAHLVDVNELVRVVATRLKKYRPA